MGKKGDSEQALRHRLVHGEYFDPDRSAKNYVKAIHQQVIRYFNGRILGEDLLNKTVDDPPRHTWGNKKYYENFIRPTGDSPLRLKEVLEDLDEHDIDNLQKYRFADDEKDELFKTY